MLHFKNSDHLQKPPFRRIGLLIASLLFPGICLAEPETVASTEHILDKTLLAMSKPRPDGLEFFQKKRIEKLDGDGKVEEVRLETFRIGTKDGEYQSDLLLVNGQTATEEDKVETRKQMMRFAQAEENSKDRPDKDRDGEESNENNDEPKWDSKKMLERFEIDLIGIRVWQGRDVFQLEFKPRNPGSGSSIQDRFLNKIEGRVFIDCEEFEIAKLQLRLDGEIEIWKGLLGKARKLKVNLERTRLAPGVWAEQKMETQMDFRMLLKSTREKSLIESYDFKFGSQDVSLQ
jgi:hypothetical protein